MFEHATLSSGPAGKRLWATCAGIAGEALLVAFGIMVPLLWPQALPRAMFATTLAPPSPPPPPPGVIAVRPRVTRAVPFQMTNGLVEPVRIPARVAMIEEPPPEPGVPSGIGVPGGDPSGVRDGVVGAILNEVARVPPPRAAAEPPPATTPSAPAPKPVQRIRVSGVRMARILHRVEPDYPPLARQMRVAGTVELQGVIATDGHLKELRIVSGHPLLARAALEAVSKWIYEPTLLNGDPVEVIAPITVTFRLN